MLREVLTFVADAGAVEDVMEASVAIPCQANRLACCCPGPVEVACVRAGLDGILAKLNDAEAGSRADAAFHAALVAALGSGLIWSRRSVLRR